MALHLKVPVDCLLVNPGVVCVCTILLIITPIFDESHTFSWLIMIYINDVSLLHLLRKLDHTQLIGHIVDVSFRCQNLMWPVKCGWSWRCHCNILNLHKCIIIKTNQCVAKYAWSHFYRMQDVATTLHTIFQNIVFILYIPFWSFALKIKFCSPPKCNWSMFYILHWQFEW